MGKKVNVFSVQGYLPTRLVYFIMNMHTHQRTIYLTRHGQVRHVTTIVSCITISPSTTCTTASAETRG